MPDEVARKTESSPTPSNALSGPVRADRLRSQVFDLIKDAVFAGRMKPGEPLRELHLAKALNVSQSTVREALTELEHAGLVVREPHRRTTVTNLTVADIRDRLRIRLALEELAIVDASARAGDADFAALEAANAAITRAIQASSHFDRGQADLDFHRLIWSLSASPVLYKTLDLITTPLFAFLGVLQKMASVSPEEVQPHTEIIDAMRTRDPEAARTAIRNHIVRSYGRILESRDDSAPYPLAR